MHIIENTINTIDELLEFYESTDLNPRPTSIKSADWVVNNYPITVLKVLRSKENVPSKYDIMVIQSITNQLELSGADKFYTYREIIEIYKNRKTTV